ncbi:hypothetical protein HDU85_006811 [Gaertneriomyces sp. JEL0708]|nr:hypothetical protein HDU85_006811 [Gaertneriomyces sp. JEL0708]
MSSTRDLLPFDFSYAPWCGACSRFTPEYEVLAEYVSNSQALNFNQNVDERHKQFGLRLGKVDIDRNPVVTSRFLVSSLPTLFYIEDQSDAKRHAPTLLSYLESESWRSQAPVNAMLSPYAFHMRLLGFVGSFGHKMTTFANYLATEVPVWGLFAGGATLITVRRIF